MFLSLCLFVLSYFLRIFPLYAFCLFIDGVFSIYVLIPFIDASFSLTYAFFFVTHAFFLLYICYFIDVFSSLFRHSFFLLMHHSYSFILSFPSFMNSFHFLWFFSFFARCTKRVFNFDFRPMVGCFGSFIYIYVHFMRDLNIPFLHSLWTFSFVRSGVWWKEIL